MELALQCQIIALFMPIHNHCVSNRVHRSYVQCSFISYVHICIDLFRHVPGAGIGPKSPEHFTQSRSHSRYSTTEPEPGQEPSQICTARHICWIAMLVNGDLE